MQCSQCGAFARPGVAECPQCGAPLGQPSGGGYSTQNADRYVPGGGAAPQQAAPNWQPEQYSQDGQRPLGSLQRRLQRSQASMPNDDDFDDGPWDNLPPARPGSQGPRSRASEQPGYGAAGSSGSSGSSGVRRPSAGGDYGGHGRRSRPLDDSASRRGSRGSHGSSAGRSRGADDRYADDDDSREGPAYSPYPGYQGDDGDSREQPAWDESRERPMPRRSSGTGHRRDLDESAEMSAEMSAEGPAYGPPRRSAPRRRSRPLDDRDDRDGRDGRDGRDHRNDDYTNPLDDPRSPLRGGQSRRPSQGGRGGRAPDDYGRGYQAYDDGDGGYGDYGQAGYSEESPVARSSRGRGGYPAPYDDPEDDYASRERYQGAPYGQAGGAAGYDAGYESDAELWPPVAVARAGGSASQARRSGARKPQKPQKRKGGALRVVFGLLVLLALVAVVGVEFGPKVYQKFLARTGGGVNSPPQATVACATEATPSAQAKPAAGFTSFATTAYTLTYPSGWQKNAQSGAAQSQCDVVYLFSQPNGAAKFNVEEAGAFATISDQQVIQAEAQSAQQQGSTFSEITSASTTQSVGGEVWQRREYQVTTTSGVKLHLALLAGHHKGAGFAIVMLSSDAGFASDDTTTFEPILHSFQFV